MAKKKIPQFYFDLSEELKETFERYHNEIIEPETALAIIEYLLFVCDMDYRKLKVRKNDDD